MFKLKLNFKMFVLAVCATHVAVAEGSITPTPAQAPAALDTTVDQPEMEITEAEADGREQ